MRRMIVAALMAVSTMGMAAVPAGADPTPQPKLTMSFDYSDNSAAAAVSNGPFNIIIDVLPVTVNGLVRMVAVPPADSNQPRQFCTWQWIDNNNQVECSFAFTTGGVWSIRAIYQPVPKADATASAYTNLRVGN
ncbi:MAG: hypothetical protein HKL86_10050 [Acidimicrobiaceae bacterium]|nr:hypothetical protein [Acidimicrobiaceae bacterium]